MSTLFFAIPAVVLFFTLVAISMYRVLSQARDAHVADVSVANQASEGDGGLLYQADEEHSRNSLFDDDFNNPFLKFGREYTQDAFRMSGSLGRPNGFD